METPVATTKPGWKTSEFWVTIGFVVISHVISIFRPQAGLAGTIATVAGDALATAGYSVARGLAKTG
jgi:hypothetical protein